MLSGDNTDGFGFIAALSESQVGWRAEAGPAVVLGAGGAARAVAVALLDAGVPRCVCSTVRPSGHALADELGGSVHAVNWTARAAALDGAALLVNTTSLGMHGQPPLDLALDALPPTALVTDVVYTPLITPLLALAQARGNPVVDGLGMLLHQARPGFRAWFGVDPEVDDDLRAVVAAGLPRRADSVFVLGLTGSIAMGKSTASHTFRCFGVPVFDADAEVHRLFAPGGAAVVPVRTAFPGCADAAGGLDRAALGQHVFRDPAALDRLEASCIRWCVPPNAGSSSAARLLTGRSPCSTFRCCTRPAASGWSTPSPWSAPRHSCRRSVC